MADDPQRDAYSRYFRALGVMAKNDIFFQFEHHLVDEFISSFEMALRAYGDWMGTAAALTRLYESSSRT